MNDLPNQLQNVWSALASVSNVGGSAIMFIGIKSGDGISLCAGNFAKLAATRASRSVWLIDLDFFADKQFNDFKSEVGNISGPFDMTFGQIPFWRAIPRSAENSGFDALVSYRMANSKLFVSKFRREVLGPNQSIQVGPSPDYWRVIKNTIDVTIIDAPPIERSRAGLALCSEMDGIVIVIDGENGDPRDAIELRDEILNRGGKLLGVIVTNKQRNSKPKNFRSKPNKHSNNSEDARVA